MRCYLLESKFILKYFWYSRRISVTNESQCLKFFDLIEYTNYSYKFHYAHDRKLIYCVIIEKWKRRKRKSNQQHEQFREKSLQNIKTCIKQWNMVLAIFWRYTIQYFDLRLFHQIVIPFQRVNVSFFFYFLISQNKHFHSS